MVKYSRSVKYCLAVLPLWWLSACAVVNGSATAAREVKSDAAIKNRLWLLSRFEATAADTPYSIGDSARYTLTLLADGSYRVRADCNRMQGAYRLESERSITLNPGPATLAECGPESHYSEYLRQLTQVRRFAFVEKTGQLKLITNTGQLIFKAAEPEAP